MRSCWITWQTISPLPQCLWLLNLAGWRLNLEQLLPIKICDQCLARLLDKLKICLHYQSVYGHQTWQRGNLLNDSLPQSYLTLQLHGLRRSCDKLKPLHLHYHSAHDHQTWQVVKSPWWAPAHKVTWSFDHVILLDYVANWNNFISTTMVPFATKKGRMVSCYEWLPPAKLLDFSVMRSCKISWQTKTILLLSIAIKFGGLATYLEGLLPI